MKRLLIVASATLLAGLLIGFFLFRKAPDRAAHHDHEVLTDGNGKKAEAESEVWTCSMHPQVKAPKPGLCPICAMDLIPLSAMGGGDGERSFSMSEAAKALAGISTVEVVREHPEAEVRLYGKIAYDETSMRTVAARFPARIDRLFVDYTGIRVEKGDHLAVVYSPDLLSAQSELLTAKEFSNQKALGVARDKLRLWGFSEEQISKIESSGKTADQLEIDAPMSGIVTHKNVNEGDYVQTGTPFFRIADLEEVWVLLDAYESDTSWLRFGQDVAFTTESIPGKTFHGRISFLSPELDASTRTVEVRVNVPNEEGLLKPGMFVSGIVHAKVAGAGQVLDPSLAGKWISPMHPEIVKEGPGRCDICGMDLVPAEKLGYVAEQNDFEAPLVIPVSSVLNTGKRSIVYVELPDTEQPTYEGREILLGPRAGEQYIVEAGLNEGERIVAEGGFVIDSALQIQAKKSMMLPGDEEGERLFPEAPATEVFLTQVDKLLDDYYTMQSALASDSFSRAKEAADMFHNQIESMEAGTLPDLSKEVWNDLASRLKESIASIRAKEEIDPIRDEFQILTLLTDEMVRRFGTANLPVYLHFCPMAFDNKGGSWLQADEELFNPYFGSSMLHCGEVKEQIAKATAQSLGTAGDEAMRSLVSAYLSTQTALSEDQLGVAKEQLTQISESLTPLRDISIGAVSNLAAKLSDRVALAQKREELESLRLVFKEISSLMEALIVRYGAGLETPLFKVHCPMAFNNVGADWVQAYEEIRNPYLGTSMLQCGEIQGQLTKTGGEAGKESR